MTRPPIRKIKVAYVVYAGDDEISVHTCVYQVAIVDVLHRGDGLIISTGHPMPLVFKIGSMIDMPLSDKLPLYFLNYTD